MEILTLLRANVKRKKGTFFGILFLMILVAALLTMLFSIKNFCTNIFNLPSLYVITY